MNGPLQHPLQGAFNQNGFTRALSATSNVANNFLNLILNHYESCNKSNLIAPLC